ncbi:hypothetical protein ACGGKE_16870 (plasmid) [Sphingobium naphthae]
MDDAREEQDRPTDHEAEPVTDKDPAADRDKQDSNPLAPPVNVEPGS